MTVADLGDHVGIEAVLEPYRDGQAYELRLMLPTPDSAQDSPGVELVLNEVDGRLAGAARVGNCRSHWSTVTLR